MESEGTTAFSLTSRIESLAPGSGWYLLWGPRDRLVQIEETLHKEARWQEVPAERVDLTPLDGFISRMQCAVGPMVTVVVDGANPADLAHILESERSQLPQARQVVFVLTREAAAAIQEEAPHFASFLEAILPYAEDTMPILSEAECGLRLESLRVRMGLTDAEVIARAQAGRLPPDPEYAEWLVLLGREDLA